MITPATLTAIPVTTTNNSSNMNSNKYKSKENIISVMTRKTTEHPQLSTNEIDNSFTRNISTFRIPKKIRSNDNIPSSDGIQSSPIQTNDNILSSSLQVANIKPNLSPVHHTKEEINSPQGKRKFSLSQYKEHKRLKPNDMTSNFSADIDMRINTMEHLNNSPPTTTTMDIDSSILLNNQSVVSPKTNNISKDIVIKSNLSEPGFKNLIKKKVIWADEKNQALVHTSVFEIDDSEVTDMHAFARQCATNISLAQIEKLMERDFRKRQGLQDIQSFDNHDNKQNLPPLPTLIRILLPDTIPIPLVKSQERFVQEEREKIVLQALLMREFLLDSPGEPDGDLLGNSMIEQNEPKLIPLDDDSSKSASDQVSSVNNNNESASTSVSLASTASTSTITPSLSSLSLANISPEVAQILAQAKEKATSSTTNDTSSTIVNTPINPSPAIPTTNPTLASLQNLTTTPNLLSALLNATRSSSIETANVLPTNPLVNPVSNLPLNLNVQPPNLSLNQLLVNALALSLSLPPPTTAFNNPIFQTSPSVLTPINPNNNPAMNQSTIRFVSPPSQQTPRFNQNNNHRGNNRGRIYRRGLHNNNNNNRRDFYQNRNNNNNTNNHNNNPNNNRNIFS